jgi:hypothetical protein
VHRPSVGRGAGRRKTSAALDPNASARDQSQMHGRSVALGHSFLAAGAFGCSGSEPHAVSTTTTVAPASSSTTTTTAPPAMPEPASLTREERLARFRARHPRMPRVPRQTIRANLAAELAARRPDRPLPQGELEQLTNKAMQIRVMRARLQRMRPALWDSPRSQKIRERLDDLIEDFQAKAGVRATDIPTILQPPPPPPRRGAEG